MICVFKRSVWWLCEKQNIEGRSGRDETRQETVVITPTTGDRGGGLGEKWPRRDIESLMESWMWGVEKEVNRGG